MAEYAFESPDGTIVWRNYPMGEAPDEGKSIQIDGVPHKRVPSWLHSEITIGAAPEYSFVSHQVDPNDAPYIDPKTGSGAFRSKAEVKKFCDRSQAALEKGGTGFNLGGRPTRGDRSQEAEAQRQAARERKAIRQLLKGGSKKL